MNLDQLAQLFSFRSSAFRLEQLQQYTVPHEEEDLAAFKAGWLPRRTPDDDEWLRKIADEAEAGKRRYRVRIVEWPLTPYTQFEFEIYEELAAAGEDIFIADRGPDSPLKGLTEDFWLFDDERIVRMDYDDNGHFLGAEVLCDDLLDEYRRRRNLALTNAVPLHAYRSRRGV